MEEKILVVNDHPQTAELQEQFGLEAKVIWFFNRKGEK